MFCPECGKRLENLIWSNSKKTINSESTKISIFFKKQYFTILVLIVIILLLAVSAPKIVGSFDDQYVFIRFEFK